MTRSRAVVLDISGTLRVGRTPIPGAGEAVASLRAAQIAVRCLSNNASESPAQVADWFRQHGFDLSEHEIITANGLAADYAERHLRGQRVMVLGRGDLVREIRGRGVHVEADGPVDAVLVALGVAFGDSVDQRAIQRGVDAIQRGAKFLAIGLDEWVPAGGGQFLPGVGSFTRTFARATGRRPTLLGKPGAWAARALLESLKVPGSEIVVVGDYAEDVTFGQRIGAQTVLVLTGCTLPWERAAVLGSKRPPTVILDSIADLARWLASAS